MFICFSMINGKNPPTKINRIEQPRVTWIPLPVPLSGLVVGLLLCWAPDLLPQHVSVAYQCLSCEESTSPLSDAISLFFRIPLLRRVVAYNSGLQPPGSGPVSGRRPFVTGLHRRNKKNFHPPPFYWLSRFCFVMRVTDTDPHHHSAEKSACTTPIRDTKVLGGGPLAYKNGLLTFMTSFNILFFDTGYEAFQ